MNISAEFAFYPLGLKNFKEIVNLVIGDLSNDNLQIIYTPISTILYGESEKIIEIIKKIINVYFTKYQAVLEVKFSNACPKPKFSSS
ncbi:YkoF family thiamine/hydroxymethylpyrimidine-binding protein [Candidatus Harpocratesius sp.]